ncbi:MAG: hypothetical protein UHN47_03580 [Lachnospiraceae bacterium]|nr:hypothetical protein [Lachnospiraceae bacterium]
MGKRKETLELEQALESLAKEKRWYGCEEITIGFYNNGHGDEICDYILMDSKGIIRCYELKVTMADLKSRAKKSWYGHYNYLVVSGELYKQMESPFSQYGIPDDVGIIVGYTSSSNENGRWLNTVSKPKRRELSEADQLMLSQSMVRSMNYKVKKYKDSKSIENLKEIEKKKRYWEQSYRNAVDENRRLRDIVKMVEYYLRHTTKIRVRLEDIAEELVDMVDSRL